MSPMSSSTAPSIPRARGPCRAASSNLNWLINPVAIADAFYYLHTQDKSCWTHELQLTPFASKPSF